MICRSNVLLNERSWIVEFEIIDNKCIACWVIRIADFIKHVNCSSERFQILMNMLGCREKMVIPVEVGEVGTVLCSQLRRTTILGSSQGGGRGKRRLYLWGLDHRDRWVEILDNTCSQEMCLWDRQARCPPWETGWCCHHVGRWDHVASEDWRCGLGKRW